VFSATHRQSVETKVSNHFGNIVEGSTELAEDELAVFVVALNAHVHEAFSTPKKNEKISHTNL
jgi:hypothetical protein